MAEPELKIQLKDLFAGLLHLAQPGGVAGEAGAEDIYQLAGLFSGSDGPDFRVTQTTNPARQPQKIAGHDDVITLLKSSQAGERRRAVQNLAQHQSEWAIDPLLYAAADSDPEVVRPALAALANMKETVNERVLSLARQEATALHAGGTIYLSYLLGRPLVFIPSGHFLMGNDPTTDELADTSEQPQHELWLPGYWISRYPVTARRFKEFLDDSRYRPRLQARNHGRGDYPVVDVAWRDALAYCEWLSRASGLHVTLPSEAEWEKAARGVDGRRYPWGNHPPTTALCNFEQATPVGEYSPQGDSPYGCADMAGNVWEWTRSAFRRYPYNPNDGRESFAGDEARVVRGLSFNNAEKLTRCAYRYNLKPMLHLGVLGFRVVVTG
jgi:formylglycine-generating enzyme required for sulfatase activity